MSVGLVKATWQAFNDDHVPRLAASVAYAAMFSLTPLFIVLIAIAGTVLGFGNGGHGHHTAEDALIEAVRRGAGAEAAQTLRQIVALAFAKPRQGVTAQVIGWVTFALGASALFGALQDALNAVWGVDGPDGGWKRMLRDRIASFGMIAVAGFLLLVSFAANAAVTFVGAHVASAIPFAGGAAGLGAVGWACSLVIATAIFALVFKVLPDVTIAWPDAWFGGLVTAVLFIIGQALIAVYLSYAGVASAYGATGSLLALLLWVYYSALILLLGAEFTKTRATEPFRSNRELPGSLRARTPTAG
jgi:membrane protein